MKEKTNILHIVKSLGRGGAEMLLQETLPYHDLSTFNFHYIYFLPWKNQMVEGIRKNGGTVENLPAKNNLVIMMQAKKIAAYIKKHNIQLVHCHLPWAGFVGRLVHRFTGVPVVYSEHNKQERYHILTKTINKATFNSQSHVVAVSADVAESISKNIRPRVPVTTILNGVNVESFKRDIPAGEKLKKELGIAEGVPVIGTIAVFRFQKRLKEWVSIFKAIEEKVPGTRGIIVGEGLLRGEIEEHIRAEGMEERIILPGLQSEVKPWYSAMDVFMMSSVFEGLPIALLEAMSMECAVACTDAGGIREVIRNNIDGFLLPVDEWPSLHQPVVNLIRDEDLLGKFAASARKRVEESFSMKGMVEATEVLYKKLLSK